MILSAEIIKEILLIYILYSLSGHVAAFLSSKIPHPVNILKSIKTEHSRTIPRHILKILHSIEKLANNF